MPTTKGVTLWLALWKVSRDIDRAAQNDIASLGLCSSDFAVLEALLHRGPLRVNDIGRIVMLTSGSMSTAVDRLERKELVRRTPGARDARVRLVELTDTGRAVIEPAYARHAETIDALFAPLGDEERRQLLDLLLKLRHSTRASSERS